MLYGDDRTVPLHFKVVTENLKLASEWLKHVKLLLNQSKKVAFYFSNSLFLMTYKFLLDCLKYLTAETISLKLIEIKNILFEE